MRAKILLVAFILAHALATQAGADERTGIVMIHGKQGTPQSLSGLAAALDAAGYLTERPEMCWSRDRIYDQRYLDCLQTIDAAIIRLKERKAANIILLGMSLGGNAVIGYGARHAGLTGLITLVPGHAPEYISQRPEVAASLDRARAFITRDKATLERRSPTSTPARRCTSSP
jgi:esterase/lipase